MAVFILSTILLLFVKQNKEVVYRTEDNKLVFESGNWAVVSEIQEMKSYNNPLALRRYAKYSFDNKLIEQGLVDNDGTFIPDNDPAESGRFFFFTVILLSVTFYLLLYAKADFIVARDWYTSRSDVAITAMQPDKRNAILKNKINCERCNTSPDFSVDRELRVQGMIFVEGQCNICLEKRKIRLK